MVSIFDNKINYIKKGAKRHHRLNQNMETIVDNITTNCKEGRRRFLTKIKNLST